MSGVIAMNEETKATGAVGDAQEYVTLTVAGQWFGIPVLDVQDVLGPRPVAHIPLADKVVAGSINLRGRIVTVIDMRKRLGLPPRDDDDPGMNIVVEQAGNLYSLRIDAVGEVMSPPDDRYDRNPATVDPMWRDFSNGIYRLENQLLIILDVEKLLERDS
ncbi:MAG: chemotaxis protein CheW [Rhodospirillales bacterium]|jgi:purine-binding chemotaxis protein CheW|nr:chemotaxis protein CheW [Rhodospirillales bacterium]